MIAYLEKFLALVERFVIATEKRNELLAKSTSHTITTADEVQTVKNEPAETGSASTGSASDAATSTSGRRNRSRATGADTNTAEETQDAGAGAAGNGRRQRSRAGSTNEAENQNAGASTEGAANNGRRQRSRAAGAGSAAPEVVPDTPEQADDRAAIESLCQLCGDVDAATADVKDFFAEKGWATATDIPAAELEAALNEMNIIADKYFD